MKKKTKVIIISIAHELPLGCQILFSRPHQTAKTGHIVINTSFAS